MTMGFAGWGCSKPAGNWILKQSSAGAGIDSFYEYLIKAYLMVGNERYLEMFNTSYMVRTTS